VSYEARVALDSQYVRNQSLWLDAQILFKTFGVVIAKTGAR
jgi:lipopolysaccharide/colanic/teichoic acid biosynthesis glycosyltransferase